MIEIGIGERLGLVRQRITAAAARVGRVGDGVVVVAVTKGHGAEAIHAAAAAGLGAVGENRVQELEEKRAAAGGVPVEWHLIGHLQRNKVRRALPLFDLLHSLDNQRLAEVVSAEAVRAGVEVRVLVQVNASGEESKGGFSAMTVASAVAAVRGVCALPGLHVEGLMTMAPFTDEEPIVRDAFRRTAEAFEACREVAGFEARHLSMGMSNDFEVAVEEGSTMVRLGTILFGERES
jgi:PLP dependent protein